MIADLFDFDGDAAPYHASAFRGALLVTHRQEPHNIGYRIGPADAYDTFVWDVLMQGCRVQSLDALPLINTFWNQPRSLRATRQFLSEAEGPRKTTFRKLAFHLTTWETLLGEMASVSQAPELHEGFEFVIHDWSCLPSPFSHGFFSIWVHRQLMRGVLEGTSRTLEKVLVIHGADKLLCREYREPSGSQQFPLSKRILALQKYGWGIIIAAQQPSEVDPTIRNATSVPVLFRLN